MGHILHSRPVASDDRLRPASHFRDLTVCRVEWPFTPRCKQALPTAGASLRMGLSHGAAEICRGLKSNEATGLNIPPSPAAVCSSHPGTPAHTLRCGLEPSQEHSEERLDERDWVYSANHRPTVCLLQYYIHSCWCVWCFVYALNVWVDGTHKIPLSFAGSAG